MDFISNFFRIPKIWVPSCHALLAKKKKKKIKDIHERHRKVEHKKFEFSYDCPVLLDYTHLISPDHSLFKQGKTEAISQL